MRRPGLIAAAVCVLLALSGLVADDDRRIARLERSFSRAVRNGAWGDAVTHGSRLDAATGGTSAGLAYNMACGHARLGDEDAAIAWLVRSVERGFTGVDLATTDPDLEPIRDLEAYGAAIAAMRDAAATRLARFQREVDAFVPQTILPPGHDPETPAPLIVALHGSGGTGAGLAGYWRRTAADLGAIVLAPDALRRTGDGYEWRYVDESEWLVLEAIERIAATRAVDREQVVLTGFSQGASIALILGARHPERFCGVVAIAGQLEPHVLGLDTVAGRDGLPRIALIAGGDDPAARSYRRGVRALRRAGFETSLEIVPRLGHALPRDHDAVFAQALRVTCGLDAPSTSD